MFILSIYSQMMEPLGFWFRSLEQVVQHNPLPQQDGKLQSEVESTFQRHAFSDKDMDELLKKLGLKPNESLRKIGRFLLENRFELKLEHLKVVQKLLPEGPFSGPKADALVAAISKLTPDQVDRGYQILWSSLQGGQPTVMGALKEYILLMNDVLAETRMYSGQFVKMEWIQKAFSEELQQWQSWLQKPELQLLALLNRYALSQDLRKFIHLSQWASKMLERLDPKSSEGLRKRMHMAERAAQHASDVMLADGILSKPEEFRHMRDHGLCYSLGLNWEDDITPCRMWAFDDQYSENMALDAKNIRLFFRWHSQNLGIIEAELRIEEEKLGMKFSSPNEEVRALMDSEAIKLEEQLNKLGYEATVSASQAVLRHVDANHELERRRQNEMVHMDAKA